MFGRKAGQLVGQRWHRRDDGLGTVVSAASAQNGGSQGGNAAEHTAWAGEGRGGQQ